MPNVFFFLSIEHHFLDNSIALAELLGTERPNVSSVFHVVDSVDDVFFDGVNHSLQLGVRSKFDMPFRPVVAYEGIILKG